MSSSSLLLCLTLFLLCLTAVNSQRLSNCCLKTSQHRIPKDRVVNYAIRTAGLCPINAIVLYTKHRHMKCIDPDSDWVKEIMRMVDQKNRTKKQKGNGKNRRGGKKKKQKKEHQ